MKSLIQSVGSMQICPPLWSSSTRCHKHGVPLRTKHSDIKRTLPPLGERLQRLDEEAAEVVRHIFSLTLEGYGPYNSYFAPGMLLYTGWLKFIIHI